MDQLERFLKVKVKLLVRQPWFGQLSCYVIPKEDARVGTACINERGELFYNEKFFAALNDKQLMTVLCHEILHLAFRHTFRIKSRLPVIWNIAADLKVNEELENNRDFDLPEGGLIPRSGEFCFKEKNGNDVAKYSIKDIPNKTTEIIYDELLKMFPKCVINISFNKQGGISSKDLEDIPEPWKSMLKKLITDLINSNAKLKEFDVNPRDLPGLEREWQSRINQANMNTSIGHIPAGLLRELRSLETPELPWHRIIRNRFSNHCRTRSWQRPAKKYLPFYFPGIKKEFGLNAVVTFDTSGSMSEDDLSTALSETVGIAQSFPQVHLWLITNDAKVWDMVEIRNGNLDKIRKMKMHGGGGTMFGPVFKLIKERFKNRLDCLIFFTDGYLGDSWPKKPSYQVFWVTRSTDVKWPFGTVLRLKPE